MTIARWQRFAVWITLAALGAALAGLWPPSPGTAVAVLAAPLMVWAAVLAVQVAAMHTVNRADPAPRASAWQLCAAWWGELKASIALFAWRQPFRAQAVPDYLPQPPTGRRGVVLVHGFLCNRAVWMPWFDALTARGHAFVAVNLEPPIAPIDHYAQALDAAVQRVQAATGRAPVLVCHSMGGMVARAWLRARAAQDAGPAAAAPPPPVHHIITLGTPHGGTWLGRFSRAINGQQMRLAGEWVAALQASEPAGQAALFTCWYSHCDNIVFPAHTATLEGADNRHLAGVAHVQMALDPRVMQACLEVLGDGDALPGGTWDCNRGG